MRRPHLIWMLAAQLSVAVDASGHEPAPGVANKGISEVDIRVEVLRGGTVSIATRREDGTVSEEVVRVDPNPRPAPVQKVVREVVPSPTVEVFVEYVVSEPASVVWFVSRSSDPRRFGRFAATTPRRSFKSAPSLFGLRR